MTRAEEQQAIDTHIAKHGVTKCRMGEESERRPVKAQKWKNRLRNAQSVSTAARKRQQAERHEGAH